MDRERLIRIKSLAKYLWNDASEGWHSEQEWPAILAQHVQDATLAAEVYSFVRSSQETVPDIKIEWLLPPGESIFADPKTIDRYNIVRRIGSGGMGIVYEARQLVEDGELPVALKLIKVGFDTEMFIRRFRSERHALAKLRHKNIVRLLDAGSTSTGRPYFVMELVEDGLPIDVYCEQKKLSISARIGLFQAVCQAVQFAHSSGILHRDLKPGNILVDQHGDPKLLDFGLAKIMTEDSSTPTFAKSAAIPMQIGTTDYMSWEQKEGRPLSFASDVCGLGLTLRAIVAPQGEKDPVIGQLIAKATEKDSKDRYQTAQDLSFALDEALSPTPRSLVIPARRSSSRIAIAAAAVSLIFAGTGGYAFWALHKKPQTAAAPVGQSLERSVDSKSKTPSGVSNQTINSGVPKPSWMVGDKEFASMLKQQDELKRTEGSCEKIVNDGFASQLQAMGVNGKIADNPEQYARARALAGDRTARLALAMIYIFNRGALITLRQKEPDTDAKMPCINRMLSLEKAEEAINWLREDAKNGSAEEALLLTEILKEGRGGTHPIPWEALYWARKTVAAGLPAGHRALAVCLWTGTGTPRDVAAAVEQWKLGVAMDEIDSEIDLSARYAFGDASPDLPKDPVLAYLWADVAASNPQTFFRPGTVDSTGTNDKARAKAVTLREEIRSSLTEEQLIEASKQSRAWVKQHRSPELGDPAKR